MEQQYVVFEKQTGEQYPEVMIFNESGYLYEKKTYAELYLRSFFLSDSTYHYFFDRDQFSMCFQEGEEFISFLVKCGVDFRAYHLLSGREDQQIVRKDEVMLDLSYEWVESGYRYRIYEEGNTNPVDDFYVGKSGRINFPKYEKETYVRYKHRGGAKDPIIKKAFKDQRYNKRIDGCIKVVFIILLFAGLIYLGNCLAD